MIVRSDARNRERFFFSLLVAFAVHYLIAVILLLSVLKLPGWETAAAGFIALIGPAVLSQVMYRWTVS